jgi:hypothetical protein
MEHGGEAQRSERVNSNLPVDSWIVPKFFFLTIFLMLSAFGSTGATNGSVDWDGIRKAFAIYCDSPSAKHAVHVMRLLPRSRVEYTGRKKENDAIDFVYDHLGTLRQRVLSRDLSASKLAFRLMTIADGAFAEDLDILLGQIIRIDPALFLQELKGYGRVGRLDALVGSLGDSYVDRIDAQRLEIKKRIQALSSVKDPAVKELRDECIKELLRQEAAIKISG